MSASKDPNMICRQATDRPKPDIEKMSSRELEQYLKSTLEKIRQTMNSLQRQSAKFEIIQNRSFCGFRFIDLQTNQFTDIRLTEVSPSVCLRHHECLRRDAECLKKAWLLMVGLLGREM